MPLYASIVSPPIPASGRYMHTTSGASSTSNALGVGTLRLIPWLIPRTITLSAIGVPITVAGEAGAKYRVGIYADNGNSYPGTLVVDGGQLAADAVGVPEAAISTTLNPGLYWVGGAVQAVVTTQPTVRTVTNWTTPVPLDFGSTNSDIATVYGYSQGSVTGALPGTFNTSVAVIGAAPRPFLKRA